MKQIAKKNRFRRPSSARDGRGGRFRQRLSAVCASMAVAVTGVLVAPQAAHAVVIFYPKVEAAYVAATTNHLVLVDPFNTAHDTFRTVAPGSNPTIAGLLSTDRYVVAFREATTGQLWYSFNGGVPVSTGLNVAANTSPSVTAVGLGIDFVVTFVAPDNHLWIYDSRGRFGTPIGFFNNGVFTG